MNIVEYIKTCLAVKNLNFSKLAELTNQAQPNLANKMKRGRFMTDELERYADAMNADLQIKFIDRDTHLPIGEQEIKQTETAPATASTLESTVNQINDKLGEICGILRRKEMELEF